MILRQQKQLGFIAAQTAVLLPKEDPYLQILKHSNNSKTMQNA